MKSQLRDQYRRRFSETDGQRERVWQVLIDAWFHRYLHDVDSVLDLGCGWGPFINQVDVAHRFGLDLNPDAADHLDDEVTLFAQPADERWPLDDASLDLVFTSNFFEHLATREAVNDALAEAFRCLRPGGRLVCMGPNIKHVGGAYWDFADHLIPLTDRSIVESTELAGFTTDEVIDRFLPYTMADRPTPPAILIRGYLRLPIAWKFLGGQFLVTSTRP